jgi:hypothetical protein
VPPAGDDIASQLAAKAAGGNQGSQGRPSLDGWRLMATLGLGGRPSIGRYNLDAAADAARGDSEQDVAQRRRLAAVMSLNPFLRFPSLPRPGSGTAGIPEWSQTELQAERHSIDALLAQCSSMMASMPTSVETDEQLLAAAAAGGSGAGPQMNVRRQQAVRVRLENKNLLLAAQAVLQQYADSLS